MHRLFISAVLAATVAGAPVWADTSRQITVSGEGQVSVDPDMATVTLGVQTEGQTPAEALDQASAATAAILAALDSQGVAADDIRSGAVRLNPRYSSSVLSSGNQIIGYSAVNTIDVQVDDLAMLGGLLAGLVGEGANRLDRVAFGLQDPTAAMDEARRRAVAEGARLAALYADAAGVSVGSLITLSDSGSSGYRAIRAEPVMLEMAASAPSYDVPVAPGQIDLQANVLMVYEIAE